MRLSDLSGMTSLEVFNFVKKHLLTQGKRALSWDKRQCAYKSTIDNTKCAAGCLISDEEYKSEWEHTSWCILVDQGIVPNVHSKLIDKLQLIHDVYEPELWEAKLNDLGVAVISGDYEKN
jgi:hypothetical protein